MVEEATPTTNSITEKMAHLLENPWIRILVGIGSAVLAFGGLWFTWQTYFGCPELAYEIPKSLAKPIYTDQSLKVFNGSNAMQNPFSTEIKFENIGSKQLEVANYDDDFPPNGPGILIQANNPGAKIVACEASWIDTSERRVPQSIVVDSKALFIKPVSLHNGEGFRLRIISDKNPMPLNVLGHLSIGKISRVEQVNWAAMGYSLWNGFLFIGALLGIISFCLHVYWYFALRSLVKLAVEKTLLAIFKVLGWFGKLFSGSGVRKHATTPQRAREIW